MIILGVYLRRNFNNPHLAWPGVGGPAQRLDQPLPIRRRIPLDQDQLRGQLGALGLVDPGISGHPARAESTDASLDAVTEYSRTRPQAVTKPKATGQLSAREHFTSQSWIADA